MGLFPLDAVGAETRYSYEPEDRLTPELLFERRWGLTVIVTSLS